MFKGSIVAMATPMEADGAVDDAALAKLVDFHVASGTDAIVAVGTTGESATLDHDEHAHVIRRVVECAASRVPVIGGTGANSTAEAIALSEAAQAAGVDACLLVTPYYNRPTQHGLVAHFKAIAQAVDLPHILYNVPSRTACDMLPDTVVELAKVSNIVGIKEATGDIDRIHELVERCGSAFDVLSGEDWMALDAILAGGKGVISVTANVAPAAMHTLCALALAGDADGARRVDDTLQPLHKALFLESNPIPTKWALGEMGMIGPGIRLPLTPLSPRFYDDVREAMGIADAKAA
ncbi:MAG: 4-hydroxy-tetrahydrodipicolinate synthase [Gammaproteobacteria bacterium]